MAQLQALPSTLDGFASILRKFITRVDHLAHKHSYQEATAAHAEVEALWEKLTEGSSASRTSQKQIEELETEKARLFDESQSLQTFVVELNS